MNDEVRGRDHRPEIQGLRAVAVLLVVAYHLYPNRMTGGYIGVDVFFVISGFLITAHLVREAATTTRLSLTRFWARRIRRLLPAALLVLAVCTALTWAYVPRSNWDDTLRHLTASSLYVENWALAHDAVDYSALGDAPTLVQHYWSLSVEEQFYLVWPLLVVGALLIARRTHGSLRATCAVVLGAVTAASFVYSVVATSADPAHAYFVTPTRGWEFGIGALVAIAGTSTDPWWSRHERLRTVSGWVGLAAVLVAGITLNDATPFPGWIATVPVLGTAVLILLGSDRSPVAVSRALSLRPMTFLGDISYAVYLWHWPLIVVLPFITDHGLPTQDRIGILVGTVVLSWASTRWVEDPVRRSRPLVDVPWRTYAAGAVGMCVVVTAVSVIRVDLDREVREARAAAADSLAAAMAGEAPCTGPRALPDRSTCGPVAGDGDPPIDPAAAARQNDEPPHYECHTPLDEPGIRRCDLGVTNGARRTVALVGDSHAAALFNAFDALGRQRHWHVITYTRSSCPFTSAHRTLPNEPSRWGRLCDESNAEVRRRLIADPDVDTVFAAAYSSAYGWSQGPGPHLAAPARDGFRHTWDELTAAGKQVVVVRDVPIVRDRMNAPTCLEEHPGDPTACAAPREAALLPDVEAHAARDAPGVRLIDLTKYFCDAASCYVVVGDVIVYRDSSHLTAEYSTLLAPEIGRAFSAVDRRTG